MSGLRIRISIALLAFTLGYAVSTVYRLVRGETITPLTLPTVAEPLASLPQVCYPGRSIGIDLPNKWAYFPPGMLSQHPWHDQFRINWYSKHLIAMKEPPMYSTNVDGFESYRFLWLRSFHHPIAVRISKYGEQHFISVKETNGAGGYEPHQLILHQTRMLAPAEWAEFIRLINRACYWDLQSEDENIGGTDGARWILEAVTDGRYHIVDRWSPDGGSYRDACIYALRLSGLNIDTSDEPVY
jgi:hypothetical protein